jgi:creatinine amidohydrolase
MLAIAPGTVRMEQAVQGDDRSYDELLPLLESGGVRSVSPSGVLGDPRGASAEEGHRLIGAAAADLAAVVAGLRRPAGESEVVR